MTGRLIVLSSSPRVAAGLLSWLAWQALRDAAEVWTGSAEHPLLPYLAEAGIRVRVMAAAQAPAALLEAATEAGTGAVIWLTGEGELPPVGDALARLMVTAAGAGRPVPELEVLPGSYDLPGARVLDLVAVMDRLRSSGGCPWDAEQTHRSLVRYLVEEAYELVEAIETGDDEHLREELGDLLLQVVFHARIAQERPEAPWSVDDVAAGIVTKLVSRHPHVFGTAETPPIEYAEDRWEQLKSAEKNRSSALDGVPAGLPALAYASKLVSRARRHGIAEPDAAEVTAPAEVTTPGEVDETSIGELLLSVVALADAHGIDPEQALRDSARRFRTAVQQREAAARPDR
ncbi:MAG TPA: MazG family protein [Actinomycetes bacterium]|nr:MazG family protein [Actinomycetes bacterium]